MDDVTKRAQARPQRQQQFRTRDHDGRAHIIPPTDRCAPSPSTPRPHCTAPSPSPLLALLPCSASAPIAVELRPHNNITAVTPPSASRCRRCNPPRRPQHCHAHRRTLRILLLLLLWRTDTAIVLQEGGTNDQGASYLPPIAITSNQSHRRFNTRPLRRHLFFQAAVAQPAEYKHRFAPSLSPPPAPALRQILPSIQLRSLRDSFRRSTAQSRAWPEKR
jgi:hypothetical protein